MVLEETIFEFGKFIVVEQSGTEGLGYMVSDLVFSFLSPIRIISRGLVFVQAWILFAFFRVKGVFIRLNFGVSRV